LESQDRTVALRCTTEPFALDETALAVGIEVLAVTLLAWMEEHGG
jgi:hypothetical protein